MKLPFVVQSELTDAQVARYRNHIDSDESGWHRRFTESIWRRHQHPSNAKLSGWRDATDRKKRLIHFYDEYGIEGRSFVLRHAYLHLMLGLPREHIDDYRATIAVGLVEGGWRLESSEGGGQGVAGSMQRWRRGDLTATLRHRAVHPEDLARSARSPPPAGYSSLDVVLRSDGYALPDDWESRPWEVFYRVGLRRKLVREERASFRRRRSPNTFRRRSSSAAGHRSRRASRTCRRCTGSTASRAPTTGSSSAPSSTIC